MKIWKLSIFAVLATLAMGLPVIPPAQTTSPGLASIPPSPAPTPKKPSDHDDQFPESVSANKKLMKEYLAAHPNELKEFTDYDTKHKKEELDLKEISKEGSSGDMKELLGITPDADQSKEDEQWSQGMKEVASEIQKGLHSEEAAGKASPTQAVNVPVPMAVNHLGPTVVSIPPAMPPTSITPPRVTPPRVAPTGVAPTGVAPTGVAPTGVSLSTPSIANLTAALKVSLGSLGSQVPDPKGIVASLIATVLKKQIPQALPTSPSGILPPPSGSTASLAQETNGQMKVHN